MKKYILAVDQSTSATKAILFDKQANLICRNNVAHKQYYLEGGWVEHDPLEIYSNVQEAINGLCGKAAIDVADICAMGISNQRETVVVWNKLTGMPVCNAIVWQCPRAAGICEKLKAQGYAELVREKTGIVLSPYFPAAKIKWVLDNVEGARKLAESGALVFGTIDTWLVWKLTNGKTFATDYSNASRTQLFHIAEKRWDDQLFDIFTIPRSMAAEVVDSGYLYGAATEISGFGELPIASCIGDSHAALFGQNCFETGMAKATYGTGSSIMMNTSKKLVSSQKGLVTSIAWAVNGDVDYVLEGNLNCTGDTVNWMKDNLKLITSSAQSEEVCERLTGNDGVYFVPAFVGLGAPYWKSDAKALIIGMKRGTSGEHIVRAGVESIAYQIQDILDLMQKESGENIKNLRVDGGPTNNGFLMQFQADVSQCRIICANLEEISALGAAFMAGITVNFWSGKEEIETLWKMRKAYAPKMDPDTASALYMGWKDAVARSILPA